MSTNREHFEELARRLAARAAELQGGKARPSLRLMKAPPSPPTMDAIVRESHCKMIRHLRKRWRAYGDPMQPLIDEACFGFPSIESLDDASLVSLHRRLERAQDCIREGVSFEDAGLLEAVR